MCKKFQFIDEYVKYIASCNHLSLKNHKEAELNAERWTAEMARLVNLEELTAELLNRIIERIEVFSRNEVDGEVRQQIKIIYRFGGYISDYDFNAWKFVHPSGKEWYLSRNRAV